MSLLRTASAFLAVAIAAIFGAASGANADGYYEPKPVGLAPASWSGYYVGVHGGYGWGDNDVSVLISVVPLVTLGGIESEGAVFGGHAGYNWQSGSVVGGLEIDISGSDIDGTADPVVRNFAGGISITDTR